MKQDSKGSVMTKLAQTSNEYWDTIKCHVFAAFDEAFIECFIKKLEEEDGKVYGLRFGDRELRNL